MAKLHIASDPQIVRSVSQHIIIDVYKTSPPSQAEFCAFLGETGLFFG